MPLLGGGNQSLEGPDERLVVNISFALTSKNRGGRIKTSPPGKVQGLSSQKVPLTTPDKFIGGL